MGDKNANSYVTTMENVYSGSTSSLPQIPSKLVKVFLSCHQSDTKQERLALLRNVYPELQQHCQQYGLDFQLVDMHQYANESMTIDHEMTALRVKELKDAYRLSHGAFFLAIVGNKYGDCVLPAQIEEAEYAHIKDCAFEAGRNINLLDEWYLEDYNSNGKKVYMLQPISAKLKHFYDMSEENKELRDKDIAQWKKTHETLRELLQQCSEYAFDEGLINEEELNKYDMSGLETEITEAINFSKDSSKNCLFVVRELEDLPQNLNGDNPEVFSYLDVKKPKPKYDKKAQEKLKKLRETHILSHVPGFNVLNFKTKWTEKGVDSETPDHKVYLKELCTQISQRLKTLIDRHMASECEDPLQHIVEDSKHLFNEATAHLHKAYSYSLNFTSRDSTLSQIKNCILSCKSDPEQVIHPVVVHGITGCGKSAVLSKLAMTATSWLGENATSIIRFPRLTLHSKTSRDILITISKQICKIYKKNNTNIPDDYNTLKIFFPQLLNTISNGARPLLIVIDSLDGIKECETETLHWLPANLPSNVFMIVSVTKGSPSLKILEKKIQQPSNYIEIPQVTPKEVQELCKLFLQYSNRTLSPEQLKLFVKAIHKNPIPLFAQLLCQETRFVSPSGNGREPLSSSADAIIRIFQHMEEKYGSLVVQHTMRYLTATNHGITEIELLDLLSCNDEIINTVYPHYLPSILRFPHRIWAGIKYDLGPLLCEVHMDNKTLLVWSNEILKSTAKNRYLGTKTSKVLCHRDFSELFLQTWVKQKLLNLPNRGETDVDENRKVAPQPLLYGETRYNMRRLSELWFHLVNSGDIKRLKMVTFCNFEYLLAKTHSTSIHHLIGDFDTIFKETIDSELELISNAVRLSLAALAADPLQLAAELIGRLLPMKDEYPQDLENLVQQAMEWCDLYTRPLLVPLSSWLPNPRDALVTTLPCEGLTWMTVTQDNQNVICATRSNTVAVYHIASKDRIREYHGHENDITCLQLSHDEKLIATGSTDKTVRMWDLETEKSLFTLTGHGGSVTCLTISHLDHRIISGSSDCTLNVYRADTGDKQHTFEGHTKAITALAVNSYDDVLASAAADTTIKVWNLDDFTLLEDIDTLQSSVICMTLSPDDTFIVSGCENGKVQLNSLTTGTEIHCLDTHKHKVSAVAVSQDATYAIVGTTDNLVHLYNMKTRDLIRTFTGHTSPITCLTVTQDDYFVMSASFDQTIKVWNLDKQPQSEPNPDNHRDQVLCVAISKDGTYAITGSKDCTLKIWNLEISQIVQSLEEHEKPITSVDLSEDCTFAVSGSDDATVKVWSVNTGLVVVTFCEHKDKITTVRILSDNQRILSADAKNSIKVWFAESGEVILSCNGPSIMVTTTPDSQFCISGDANEKMKIWQVGDGKSVHTIRHLQPITCFTVTKDNQFCITGSEDTSLKVWEIKTGKITQILADHEDGVTCVAVADHNRHVVSGSADKTLIIWNMMTGEVDKRLTGHSDGVTAVRMTTDGSIAISGSKDGTLRVWSVQRGILITSFYMHVGVVNLEMSFDASHIIVQLADGGHAPLLCLHNSPATDVKSQSQVDINLNEDSASILPIKPKPPLVSKASVVFPPAGGRKSTVSQPTIEQGKVVAPGTTSQTTNKKSINNNISSSSGSNGTPKKNKKSGVCVIV